LHCASATKSPKHRKSLLQKVKILKACCYLAIPPRFGHRGRGYEEPQHHTRNATREHFPTLEHHGQYWPWKNKIGTEKFASRTRAAPRENPPRLGTGTHQRRFMRA
jgi:hypothetical protein